MRFLVTAAALTLLAAAVGCGRPRPAAPVAVIPVPPDTSHLPLFDDLNYANWKRFPVGTVVRRRSVTSAENATASTVSVERLTLKKLTDDEATVERQNTTERSDGSYRAVNPPELRKYPRQFPIPAGMSADDFALPARGARRDGEEVLTVLGKEYRTTRYAWADSTEGGKMDVRVWLSDDMPGRIVKQEMVVAALKNTTLEEVIDVTTP